MRPVKETFSASSTLKRRVGYADEELSITRAKLANLELEEEKEHEDGDARMIGLD